MAEIVSEEQFEREALAFLEANAKLRVEQKKGWGQGSDSVALFAERSSEEEEAEVVAGQVLAAARCSTPASGGSPGPRPTAAGRCPRPTSGSTSRAKRPFDTPSQAPFGIGLGMVAPTILAHATEATGQRYLRSLYRGDIIACQLFSEPSAGLRPGQPPDQGRA